MLLFMESFDGYMPPGSNAWTGSNPFMRRWNYEYTGGLSNLLWFESGKTGNCLRLSPGTSAWRLQTPTFANTSTIIVGCHVLLDYSSITNGGDIFTLTDTLVSSSTTRIRFRFDTSGLLQIYNGSTYLATGSTVLSSNQWYHIQLKVTIHPSAGAVELLIDGAVEFTLTGVNTRPASTNNYVNALRLYTGQNTGVNTYLDNLYILDTTGATNNDYLGECEIDYLLPNGSNTQNWTPDTGTNYTRVNEAPPDGNTSYVETSTSSAQDIYEFSNVSEDHPIAGIEVDVDAINASSSYKLLVNGQDGNTYNTSASYAVRYQIFETDPNTTDPWTKTLVDSSLFGFEHVSGTPRISRIGVGVLRILENASVVLEQEASNELALLDLAESEISTAPIELEVSSVFDLVQQASLLDLVIPDPVESILGLFDSVDYRGPKLFDISSLLSLTDLTSRTHPQDVSSVLELEGTAVRQTSTFIRYMPEGIYTNGVVDRNKLPVYEDEVLNLIDSLTFVGPKRWAASSAINTNHEVTFQQAVNNQSISHRIEFVDRMGITYDLPTSSALLFIQDVYRRFIEQSPLGLNQIIDVFQTKDAKSVIPFSHILLRGLEASRNLQQPLGIYHSVSYYSAALGLECRYSPQIGDSGGGVNPPPSIQPVLGQTTLTLTYPFVSPTTTLVLRNPLFGNIDRLNFQRVKSYTRGGSLLVYANPKWPKEEIMSIRVEGLSTEKKENFIQFIRDSLGREIGLRDHENRLWRGLIITPESTITHVHNHNYAISFDFDGVLV